MANTEKSKLKTLLLYDYFLKNINAYDENSSVSLPDIQNYLLNVTGVEFERKSIYADIKRLNEFAVEVGLVKPGEEWIYLNSRKYTRGEISYELSLDEARLIVDAIRTTPFTDSGLCEKIEKRYPAYFKGGYKALIPHDNTVKTKTKFLLNTVRLSIEKKQALVFKYGYNFAGGLRAVSDKTVSALALDFENGYYYLIAVDNEVYEKCHDLEKSIRRYRVDRMKSYILGYKVPYYGDEPNKDKILEKYLKNSIDAFSSETSRLITITLRCDDEKTLLRAYGAFANDVKIKRIGADQPDKGIIEFSFDAGPVPTLFTQLFKLYTFDGLKVEIDDEEIREKFREYLNRALNG